MYTMEGRVRFSETGANGKLSVGGLIDYFQDCSTLHSQDVGLGPDSLAAGNRAWIINSWQVEIFRLPKLGEKISVDTWPYSFRKFIGNRNYVLRDKDNEVCARADSIWALYDMAKSFPAVMSQEEIDAYDIEPRLDMEERSRKIRVEGDFKKCDTFTVMRDRLDSNIHLNNGQYVKISSNYLPEDREVSTLRVEYKNSIKLGDEVCVMVCQKDDLFYVRFDDQEGNEYSVIEYGLR
ncbi:MAG: acyl-[Lachnospiraceae bacterium]|nr:acyl-[acyl-carrier-protein] thioesterase [Lachnospiraceae bacterium]